MNLANQQINNYKLTIYKKTFRFHNLQMTDIEKLVVVTIKNFF